MPCCAARQAAAAAGLPQEAIPACRQMKVALLSRVAGLKLPANFLDVLIDELGGPKRVAEMTGRKGRVVRQVVGAAGRQQVVYELRAKPDSSEMDSLNGVCVCVGGGRCCGYEYACCGCWEFFIAASGRGCLCEWAGVIHAMHALHTPFQKSCRQFIHAMHGLHTPFQKSCRQFIVRDCKARARQC